jgi:hypothetical protein
MSSPTAAPASRRPKICARPDRAPRLGHAAPATDVLAERVVPGPAVAAAACGTFVLCTSKEQPMTTLKSDQQKTDAAARKAERERDSVQAWKDYQAEKQATDDNMKRLRALRLARESADRQRKRGSK